MNRGVKIGLLYFFGLPLMVIVGAVLGKVLGGGRSGDLRVPICMIGALGLYHVGWGVFAYFAKWNPRRYVRFGGTRGLPFRGIAIYRSGKIRVFRRGVTTLRDGFVEDVTVRPCGERAELVLRISGRVFGFDLSHGEAEAGAAALLDTLAELEEFGF